MSAPWGSVVPPNEVERRRLRALGEMCDRATFHYLRALGVGPGWRCLEAGAGDGSVARWLSERVGDGGRVVATDIDPRLMDVSHVSDGRNVEVLRHDLTADPRPGDPYDLVHARLVLMHLPQRLRVLGRLASWLRPGGWLLIEDSFAVADLMAPPSVARSWDAVMTVLGDRVGTDRRWGLTLPGPFPALGLVEVGATAVIPPLAAPGEAGVRAPVLEFLWLTIEQLRPALPGTGLATEGDIDEAVDLLRRDDVSVRTYGWGIVSAWGRRAA
jgi:SAM-dependent methyltransferase